jgi:TBC1 domain family member 5
MPADEQGMHELLAVCLLVVDRDSLALPDSNGSAQMVQAMYTTLDRRYVEHDAFELFMAIMKLAKAFYEWRQEEGPVSLA